MELARHFLHPMVVVVASVIVASSGCIEKTAVSVDVGESLQAPSWRVGLEAASSELVLPWDGDLALAWSVVLTEPGDCRLQFAAWGVSDDLGPTFGVVVAGSEGKAAAFGRGQSNGEVSLRAHALSTDMELRPGAYVWAAAHNRSYSTDQDRAIHVQLFAAGLESPLAALPAYAHPSLDASHNVYLAFDCSTKATLVNLYMGRQVTLFDHTDMRDGAGLSGRASPEPNGIAVSAAVAQDVESERGIVIAQILGRVFGAHVGIGRVEIQFPGGEHVLHEVPGHSLVDDISGEASVQLYERGSGPGEYRVVATYAGAGGLGTLRGALAGLDEVKQFPVNEWTARPPADQAEQES